MKIPIEHYKNIILLLQLDKYAEVLFYLNLKGQKHVSSILINNMIDNETEISEIDYIDQVRIYNNAHLKLI